MTPKFKANDRVRHTAGDVLMIVESVITEEAPKSASSRVIDLNQPRQKKAEPKPVPLSEPKYKCVWFDASHGHRQNEFAERYLVPFDVPTTGA